MKFNVSQLLEKVVSMHASDLHLSVGTSPVVRINTVLSVLTDIQPLAVEDVEYFLSQLLTQQQKDIFDVNKEIDFSIALSSTVRFRVNAFHQKGYPSAALRIIPIKVPTLEENNLPPIIGSLCELHQGLVIVTGPTGQGKSTTIASMLDRINNTRSEHIITVEDPIEYIFTNKQSFIEQREMYLDTHSWEVALRSILREDPNVVVVGEMRDFDTIAATITIAETGHLVFASLHTNSASQTIDRIIDSFPETQQGQVRLQLSQIIEAVISQRLIPSARLGMVPAIEIMLASTAVKNLIREGKTYQLDNIISTSSNLGMLTLESSIANLIENGSIEYADALRFSSKPDELRMLISRGKSPHSGTGASGDRSKK